MDDDPDYIGEVQNLQVLLSETLKSKTLPLPSILANVSFVF